MYYEQNVTVTWYQYERMCLAKIVIEHQSSKIKVKVETAIQIKHDWS